MARELLSEAGSLEKLSRMEPSELQRQQGIGPAKACTLAAALELGRRLAHEELKEEQSLNRPEESGAYLVRIYRSQRNEIFGCLFLDRRNRILKHEVLFRGTRDASPVDPAEIFRKALFLDASRIILFHNHPSGNPEASEDDRHLTRRLVRAGRLLSLEILDHIILAGPRWVSLRSRHQELFGPES
jgi:DNA repair protein RadC